MTKPDLILASSGDGWLGTFGIALRATIEDILSDGAPFTARLEWEDDNGKRHAETLQVEDLDPAAGHLVVTGVRVMAGGLPDRVRVIELDQIRRLEA